jgi:hypothetical protein
MKVCRWWYPRSRTLGRSVLGISTHRCDQGFALPLAMGLGFVMMIMGMSTIMIAQGDRSTALQRKESSASLAVTEGGLARTLVQLVKPNNSVLLNRNYDPINPKTGKTYFGPDGILNSGDEENTAVNQWSSIPATACSGLGTPSISYNGTIGTDGRYTLKAYRYNQVQKTGTFLIEGKQGTLTSSSVAVTLSIDSTFEFPGIVAFESIYLQGRNVFGNNGNLYYNPSDSSSGIVGSAAPGTANRAQFLNAIWSGSMDGYNDTVSGKLVACQLSIPLSASPQGTNLGTLKGSNTVAPTGSGVAYYQTSKVELESDDVWQFDTTDRPIYLYVTGRFSMEDNARILNVRRDGQPPRVGDLRIISLEGSGYEFGLYDNACIHTAFLYNPGSDLQVQTSGAGCPNVTNTNVVGVVWVEDLLSSRNNTVTRIDPDYDGDIIRTNAVTSGIRVPDDVSSLSDIVGSLNLPTKNKLGPIQKWQQVRL